MEKFTVEEEQIKEVIISARILEEYLWGDYNGEWNIEEWRRMFRKRIQKIDDIDVNNPHAIIEMRKRLMQNAALSVALMKILDTKGIPVKECDIPSNLPQYAEEKRVNMRKIIIAGSAKFYQEALELKKELEKMNYSVIDYPKNINVNIETEYKEAYESFYENLNKADDLILLNLDKNGIEGYIGYESFAELSNLVVKKIQDNNNHMIYIYKMPSKEVGCYDEIKHFLELGYIKLYK